MSCLCRWAQFRQCINDIKTNVKSLRDGDPVSYKQSIGSAYYVSITSGFYCIDIRKFYLPYGERTDIRPTRQELALRLREWDERKCEKSSTLSIVHTPLSVLLCRVTWETIIRTRSGSYSVSSVTCSLPTSTETLVISVR